MSFWSFVALAVVCVCALEAYRAYVKSKTAGSSEVARLEARIAALEGDGSLEDRVRTLEAIVTDPKDQLDRELRKLETNAKPN